MPTETPPPRRKRHFGRWLIIFIVATLAWSGWRAYAYRSAISQARALGWEVRYTDPVEEIRANWKNAFKKKTWLDGVRVISIPRGEEFEQHLAIVHRLNPMGLRIDDAHTLSDLSALKPLHRLEAVGLGGCAGLTNVEALKNFAALRAVVLDGCTGLTNVDALKSLSALEWVSLPGCTGLTNVNALKSLSAVTEVRLNGCTGLTNVDALKNLPALQWVTLDGCTGLTEESVAALKSALPKAKIIGP